MDPLEAGKLIILLGGLAALYLKINKAMREMTGKGELREISPNPLNVQEHHRHATMEDVEAVQKRVARLEKHVLKVESNQVDIENKIDGMRDRLDDKIDDLKESMSDNKDLVSEKLGEVLRAVGRLEGH